MVKICSNYNLMQRFTRNQTTIWSDLILILDQSKSATRMCSYMHSGQIYTVSQSMICSCKTKFLVLHCDHSIATASQLLKNFIAQLLPQNRIPNTPVATVQTMAYSAVLRKKYKIFLGKPLKFNLIWVYTWLIVQE